MSIELHSGQATTCDATFNNYYLINLLTKYEATSHAGSLSSGPLQIATPWPPPHCGQPLVDVVNRPMALNCL